MGDQVLGVETPKEPRFVRMDWGENAPAWQRRLGRDYEEKPAWLSPSGDYAVVEWFRGEWFCLVQARHTEKGLDCRYLRGYTEDVSIPDFRGFRVYWYEAQGFAKLCRFSMETGTMKVNRLRFFQ